MMRCTRLSHMKVSTVATALAVGAALFGPAAAPASAQVFQVTRSDAKHSVGFNFGYFAVRGEDARVDEDVLLANLNDLAFEIGDFSSFTFGGEYLYGVNNFLEVGGGIGYYQKSVPSLYRDYVDIDGTEILQDLKLRIMPITATVRFIPTGRGAAVQPYVGGGLGIIPWRYTESGEFVDFSDGTIFRARYEADGTAIGPVFLGGVRFPIADVMTTGVEFRWQKAEGDTHPEESELLGSKIDLGGWSTSWTFAFRF